MHAPTTRTVGEAAQPGLGAMSTPQPTPAPVPDGRYRFAVFTQAAAAVAAFTIALVYHTVILTLSIRDGRTGAAAQGRIHPGNV